MLTIINHSMTQLNILVLILGDFNARILAWDSRITDKRRRMVEDWALETGLVALNWGPVYVYEVLNKKYQKELTLLMINVLVY